MRPGQVSAERTGNTPVSEEATGNLGPSQGTAQGDMDTRETPAHLSALSPTSRLPPW